MTLGIGPHSTFIYFSLLLWRIKMNIYLHDEIFLTDRPIIGYK